MRIVAFIVPIVALMLVGIAPSAAVAADKSEIRAQFNKDYQQLLITPADRKLNLNYAALAIQLKDYEAAISPLERILMHEPDNAKIRLQIGVLYHLLGSDVIARQYFEATVTTTGAAPDVVAEAKRYLHGA